MQRKTGTSSIDDVPEKKSILYTQWKMELKRIATRKIGAIHLIITVNNFSLLNEGLLSLISSPIACGLIKKPTKIQVRNATTGINTLLLIKSIKSRMDRFRI